MVVSFHELAEREFNDAAQYYKHDNPAWRSVHRDVRRCTDAIAEHPEPAL